MVEGTDEASQVDQYMIGFINVLNEQLDEWLSILMSDRTNERIHERMTS